MLSNFDNKHNNCQQYHSLFPYILYVTHRRFSEWNSLYVERSTKEFLFTKHSDQHKVSSIIKRKKKIKKQKTEINKKLATDGTLWSISFDCYVVTDLFMQQFIGNTCKYCVIIITREWILTFSMSLIWWQWITERNATSGFKMLTYNRLLLNNVEFLNRLN